MKRIIHEFDLPERCVAGTVGEPGDRTFFVQVRSGKRLTSVVCEKGQIYAIAERIELLFKELRRNGSHFSLPKVTPDNAPLETPILEEFRVGVISLSWLSDRDSLLLQLQALEENPGDDAPLVEGDQEGPDILRIILSAPQGRSFATRALALVGAGRQPCTFCGLPLDPGGHVCPRANGYRR